MTTTQTTDRDLLKFAAKAAGIFLTREQFERDCSSPWTPDMGALDYDEKSNSVSGWATIYGFNGELSGWGMETWAPLTDDGDALRLAALLVMDFRCDAADGEFRASCYAIGALGHACPGEEFEVYVAIEPDDIGTTAPYRRAAVQLAAMLGKAMP